MKIYLLILLAIHLLIHFFVPIKGTFVADSLLKAIQGESLYKNNFNSEKLFYPAIDIDPEFEYYIFRLPFAKFVNEEYIGQYPFLFSVYSGLILKFHFIFIPILSVLFIFLSFYLLKKTTNADIYFSLLFALSSFLLTTAFDLNEVPLFFLISTLGFYFIIEFLKSKSFSHLFFSFFFVSIAVWFRLEAILFIVSLALAILLIFYLNKNFTYKYIIIFILSLLPLYLFFFRNLYIYEHFLGNRYFFNYHAETGFLERIYRIYVMSFFWKNETGIKTGIFFCTPILLISLSYFLKRIKQISDIILFSIIVFILQYFLVSFTSPNDGITLTARYHVLLYIPGFILANEFRKELGKSKLYFFSGIFSSLFILILCSIWIFFSKEVNSLQTKLNSEKADLYIIDKEELCGSMGLSHLKEKILCVRETLMPETLGIIKDSSAINKIKYITINTEDELGLLEDLKKANMMQTNKESFKNRIEIYSLSKVKN
jgi:hypothetical protein